MANKKECREDQERRERGGQRAQHLAEKHYRNAFRNRSFGIDSLSEADLDELGFDDDNDGYY